MSRVLVDSGIGYLEKIPSEWNIFRIKNAFKCEKNIVNDNWNNTQLLSLTTTGVKEKDIDNPNGKLPDSFAGYQYVEKNNIIMCLFDLDCSAVFSGISKYNGMISPAYKVLECKKIMNPDYAGYYFNYISFDRKYMHYSKNIRYTLNYDEFSSLPMVIPPLEEQKRIAIYLNDRCSKIDEITVDNNKEIELLKEYKQLLICKNTSNGVKTKLKYVFKKVGSGTTPDSNDSSLYGDDIFWIQSGDINGGYIIDTNKKLKENTVGKVSALKIYKAPFIVIAMYGGSIGNSSISNIDACTNQACCVLSETDANLNYIFYSIKKLVSDWLSTSEGGTQPNVNRGKILNSYVNLPTKEEQDIIVEKLDQECSKLDEVIEYRRKIIEKLEEYKRSLIYECVTGKREV